MKTDGAVGLVPRRHGLNVSRAEYLVHLPLGCERLLADPAFSYLVIAILLYSSAIVGTLILYCVEGDLEARYFGLMTLDLRCQKRRQISSFFSRPVWLQSILFGHGIMHLASSLARVGQPV